MQGKKLLVLKSVLLMAALIIFALAVGNVNVRADEKKYKGKVHDVKSALNVRKGAGKNYDSITDESGNILQLKPDEEVVIIGQATAADGTVWYNVEFERDGKKYNEGYASSNYIEKGAEITEPPTPTPTATPEPTPTSIAEVATKAPSQPTPALSDNANDGESEQGGGNPKKVILGVIFAVIAVAVVFFGLFIVLGLIKQNKRKNRIRNARKVDRMRSSEQENQGGKRKPEIRRSEDDGAYVREVRQSVYYTNPEDDDELYGLVSQEPDDKRTLRAAVDRLQEHDIINHKVYGEGEVYDNSDVKLMEVRFGNDVRFLNKDSIVQKRLIEIIDDEDQATARRRNRRNRNKRNDY